MDLNVLFVGTAGSAPTDECGPAATLVRRGGERMLFDRGEGTQRQLVRSTGLVELEESSLPTSTPTTCSDCRGRASPPRRGRERRAQGGRSLRPRPRTFLARRAVRIAEKWLDRKLIPIEHTFPDARPRWGHRRPRPPGHRGGVWRGA
ncbi:MAG: hypothetical protein ACR2J6_02330, partial [Thermoleophilaceae bacterium]